MSLMLFSLQGGKLFFILYILLIYFSSSTQTKCSFSLISLFLSSDQRNFSEHPQNAPDGGRVCVAIAVAVAFTIAVAVAFAVVVAVSVPSAS